MTAVVTLKIEKGEVSQGGLDIKWIYAWRNGDFIPSIEGWTELGEGRYHMKQERKPKRNFYKLLSIQLYFLELVFGETTWTQVYMGCELK